MAENKDNWVRTNSSTNGLGGTTQDLNTGLVHDANGDVVEPEVRTPRGTEEVQVDKIGVYDRHVFSDGSVATVQVRPANQGDGLTIVTPVPLPGEQQDVSGTGQDAATKPKVAPGAKKS